jgi:hypothetical protein
MRWKQLQRRATWRGGQDGHSDDVFRLDPAIHPVNKNNQKNEEEGRRFILPIVRARRRQSLDHSNCSLGSGFQIDRFLRGLSKLTPELRRE